MNIQEFKFPQLTAADSMFSTIKTDQKLLAEAKDRGFYNGNTKYNDLFSNLFFNGGKLNLKKDLSPDFREKALPYLKAFMQSFEPRHEEKEAISALLLSEMVEA